jgi:hypothetical protein
VAISHSEGRSLLAVELMAFMVDLELQNPFRPVGHQETLNQLLGLSNSAIIMAKTEGTY